MATVEDDSIPELGVVDLKRSLEHEGRVLPKGNRGTVVHAYGDGAHFEVEFTEPLACTVTVMRNDIAPVPSQPRRGSIW